MEYITSSYKYVMDKMSDSRTADYPLMSSPWPMAFLTLLYLLVVWQGPKFMSSRAPFDLKPLLIVYNFGLVLLSSYMFLEFFLTSVLNPEFSLFCEPMDYSQDAMSLRLANVCWWYLISKPIEFLDTIFFILRKKNSQISFLHVYHHASMVPLWWVGVKFVPGGEAYFSAMINSFIHVLMYSYYMLSAFGPHMQKYLWWKKYMTSLQLMQFLAIVFHTSHTVYLNCGFPRGYQVALILYATSHLVLFSNFYYNTYIQNGKAKRAKQDVTQNVNGNEKSEAANGPKEAYRNGVVRNANGVKTRNMRNGTRPKKVD